MATALTIIEAALRNIGAVAIEETVSAGEAQDALNALNNMIATWNTEKLMVYSINEEVFPVVANQPAYTMGVGGNFNTTRPVKIENVSMRDAAGNDYYVGMISQQEYNYIITPNTTSSLPNVMYDDQNFPLKTLRFWPIASDPTYSFVINSWRAVSSFPVLTTPVLLPPGYQSAIEFNLSVWLSPRYGKTVSNDLRALAIETKAQIKKINYVVEKLIFDTDLSYGGRAWNYLVGY